MSAIVLPARPAAPRDGGLPLLLFVGLGAWLALVVTLGASGAFIGAPRTPPIALAAAISLPLLAFFAGLWLSRSFRAFLLSLDLAFIAGLQAWRFAGIGFVDLYAFKLLPAFFALPAGLGDMAIGFAAPGIVLALARRPDFAAGRIFVRWNLLGMLDLIVAIALGTIGATLATGAPGEISTTPMGRLPLLLVPAFLVPFFFMLHVAALMQSRRMARGEA